MKEEKQLIKKIDVLPEDEEGSIVCAVIQSMTIQMLRRLRNVLGGEKRA